MAFAFFIHFARLTDVVNPALAPSKRGRSPGHSAMFSRPGRRNRMDLSFLLFRSRLGVGLSLIRRGVSSGSAIGMLGCPTLEQGRNLIASLLGQLSVGSHQCTSGWPGRGARFLPLWTSYPTPWRCTSRVNPRSTLRLQKCFILPRPPGVLLHVALPIRQEGGVFLSFT